MTNATATVVQRSVVIDAPPDRGFAVFVERFDRVKPREHNLLGAPIAETVVDPGVGGHTYDRATDGSVCR